MMDSSARAVAPVPFSVCTYSSLPSRRNRMFSLPGLVVGGVRARGDLAVALLGREPRLDVVLLGGGRAEVADRDVHHPVRQPEALDDLLLVGEQPSWIPFDASGVQ